jgi:hypothetical protein
MEAVDETTLLARRLVRPRVPVTPIIRGVVALDALVAVGYVFLKAGIIRA